MVANTSLTRRVLGGVVGVNLALAIAVGAGAVPRPGENVQAAAATQVEELAAPAARQAGDVAPATETPAPAAAPTPTTAAPATTVAQPKPTTPPTTKAPKPAAAPKTTTPAPAVTTPAPAPTPAVVAATKVPRRVPTSAEVDAVIARLKKDIPTLKYFTISPAQIDQAGDQICTAFDNGQTFAQVKATGLSMVPAAIKVPAATADYAVRQAVAMYCPGNANKLV